MLHRLVHRRSRRALSAEQMCTVIPVDDVSAIQITDFKADIIMVTSCWPSPTNSSARIDPRSTNLKSGIFGAERPTRYAPRSRPDSTCGVDIYGVRGSAACRTKPSRKRNVGRIIVIDDRRRAEARRGVVTIGRDLPDHPLRHPRRRSVPVASRRCGAWTRFSAATSSSFERVPEPDEEHIVKIDGISPHYQIELGKDGPLDTMTVRVEAASGHEGEDSRAALAAKLMTTSSRISAFQQLSRSVGARQVSRQGRRSTGVAIDEHHLRRRAITTSSCYPDTPPACSRATGGTSMAGGCRSIEGSRPLFRQQRRIRYTEGLSK